MSKKPYITLQPTEQTIVTAAAQIYAAFITNGMVEPGDETKWLKQSVHDAIRLARITDDTIQADKEDG